MKHSVFGVFARLAVPALVACFLISCGDDDDDFSPVARNRGYDYAFVSTGEFAEYPCNEMREGRDAAVGRDKDIYTCVFDRADSLYLWVGDEDTLTAIGREYHRPESSSSSDEDDENSSSSRNSSSSYSSSSWIASSSSTPRNDISSSSYYRSSSSRKSVNANPRLTEKGEQFNPAISYGIMTDGRDGKKYKTVVVNGQNWMAENLNYAGNEYGESFCFNDDDEFCELYGRLYTREAAMNSPDCPSGQYCNLGDGPIQGICPEGWHIPTYEETETLINYIGDNVGDWISSKGWKPELLPDTVKDTYGLSFVPGGMDESKGFRAIDTTAFMWVYLPNGEQRYFLINVNTREVFIHNYTSYVSIGVRCVKGKANPVSSSSRSSSSSARSSSSSARSSSSYWPSTWSSESPSSSFSIGSKEDLFNPDLTYGTMTDPRDGKKYKTIVFNGQTWMAENLNFADSSIYPLLKGNTQCYHEKESECELFGRLYSREAAMGDSKCAFGFSCSLGSGPIQGICPDNWHVMSATEVNKMISYVGSDNADKIMSAKGWGSNVYGTNTYGLSFIAPGTRDGVNYDSKGGYAYNWIYIEYTSQYYFYINGPSKYMNTSNYNNHELYLPVRCIADEPTSSSSSSVKSSSSVSSSSLSSSSSAPPSSSSVKSSSSSYSSSSSVKSSSSVSSSSYLIESKSDLFNPSVSYGAMTDSRDSKTYKTVVIDGKTWMAENLNYNDDTKNPLLKGNSLCYNGDDKYCELLGRLYSRSAVMNDNRCAFNASCDLGEGSIQGICPDGWHVPSHEEGANLVSYIGAFAASDVRSANGWNDTLSTGLDTYGLSFAGYASWNNTSNRYSSLGEYAYTWLYKNKIDQYYLVVRAGLNNFSVMTYGDAELFLPIRCVKD